VITLAHVSDLHIGQDRGDDGARAALRARNVVDHLNAMPGPIDAVLVTGDLADHGTAAEYRTVAEILGALRFPVLTCPGNHDRRGPYRTVLLGETGGNGDSGGDGEPVNRLHRLPGLTVAMCDSTIPGRDDGLLDDTTVAWLDAVLSENGAEPALVCFHHPPVLLHMPFVDRIRQFGAERLADVLARHDNAVAVLCGHAHTGAAATFAGRPVIVAPGVVSTVMPPFESAVGIDYELPPSIALHVLDDDRGLVTHFRSV
jgi:3',5'-cyclic-AMP phosphodiesterase